MITHNNIVDYIRNSLETYFRNPNNQGGQFDDFADNMEVFAENSYGSSKDIIITAQFLPGTTQLGFTDIPINLIFEVIEGKATNGKPMATEVMDLINTFVIDSNDKTITGGLTDDNGQNYICYQYFSSSNAIGNGQNRGTNKYKAFNVEMRLIIFENGKFHTLDETTITIDNETMTNLLDVNTNINHTLTSYTAGTNPRAKYRIESIQWQLSISYMATKKQVAVLDKGTLGIGGTISFLPTASNSNAGFAYKTLNASSNHAANDWYVSNGESWIHIPFYEDLISTISVKTLAEKIANDALTDKNYSISFLGLNTVARTSTAMKLVQYTESTPYADVTKVTAVFVGG